MNQQPMDSGGFPQHEERGGAPHPLEAFGWWEKHRLIFNIAVGLSGLLPMALFARHVQVADGIGLLMYGLTANLFYSLGFLLEMADMHYIGGKLGLHRFREAFLVLGTMASMGITAFGAWIYYALGPFLGLP